MNNLRFQTHKSLGENARKHNLILGKSRNKLSELKKIN